MILQDPPKTAFLVAVHSQHVSAPALVRRVYEAHDAAKAAVRLAANAPREQQALAVKNAAKHRARWRRCREKILVMRWEKALPHQ